VETSYKPQEYWERIGDKRSFDGQFAGYRKLGEPHDDDDTRFRRAHRDHLARAFEWYGWRTVLDGGCGPGFWFQLWDELDVQATGVDFSDGSLRVADRVARKIGRPDYTTLRAPLDALPFEDGSFEVATLVKVCLHVPPRQLPGVLLEMSRVARNIVICDWYDDRGSGVKTAAHVSNHNFPALFEYLGLPVLQQARDFGNQWFWVLGDPKTEARSRTAAARLG
jgi:SAM-dependent methyltransferase